LSNSISVPETEYDFPNDDDENNTVSIRCIIPKDVQFDNPKVFSTIGPVSWQKHMIQKTYWERLLHLSDHDIILVPRIQIHITYLTLCRHWGIKIHAKVKYLQFK
jgi:hypothetical protein